MSRVKLEVLAGLFVIVGVIVLGVLAVRVGGVTLGRGETIELQARFSDATGIKEGSPVKLAGVVVGEVASVRLGEDERRSIVRMLIRESIDLPVDTMAQLRTNGLIGDRFIFLDPGKSEETLGDGDVITNTAPAASIQGVLSGLGLGAGPGTRPTDPFVVRARFTDVTGISEDTPVRIAGVDVGKVTEVELNLERMLAVVTMEVRDDLELTSDTIAAVRTSGLIGGKFIELKPGGAPIPLEEGGLIVDTEPSLNIESLISRFAFGSVDEKE